MAMGLNLLGRGKKQPVVWAGTLHLVGAILGGASLGGLLGWLGSLFRLTIWRPEIIAAIAVFALWHSLNRQPPKLGPRCQVPRTWKYSLPIEIYYFLCGALLGCGIATLIPYSSFLVILGSQLTSGVVLGSISGALFGGVREAMVLILLLNQHGKETKPSDMMWLLPALSPKVQRLNVIWVFGGSLLLVLASLL